MQTSALTLGAALLLVGAGVMLGRKLDRGADVAAVASRDSLAREVEAFQLREQDRARLDSVRAIEDLQRARAAAELTRRSATYRDSAAALGVAVTRLMDSIGIVTALIPGAAPLVAALDSGIRAERRACGLAIADCAAAGVQLRARIATRDTQRLEDSTALAESGRLLLVAQRQLDAAIARARPRSTSRILLAVASCAGAGAAAVQKQTALAVGAGAVCLLWR